MNLAKICVLGEVSVGKTSLLRRFIDREFSDEYLTTVGVKISRKLLRLRSTPGGPASELQFVFWDLEGGRNSIDLSPTYLKGARGAIIVGDLSRAATIEELQGHIIRFREVNPEGRVVVALNKADLHHETDEATLNLLKSDSTVVATMPTSAKSGVGVDDLFKALGMSILQDAVNAPDH